MSPVSAVAELIERQRAPDGSVKYLWGLADGERVESVLFRIDPRDVLPSPDAYATTDDLVLCVSSQPGCNVGCRFCATGLQAARRGLSSEEILAQAHGARADHLTHPMKAIFAGMGEPLLNYEHVVRAATVMLDTAVVRGISINTIGIPDRVRRLAREPLPLNLYVSLHATTDEVRTRLVPLNRRHPIAATLAAASEFARERATKVRIGYLLLPGVNASARDAEQLLTLLDPALFHVQLLLWNEVDGLPFERIDDEAAVQFCQRLHSGGLTAHVIRSSGRKVRAGCGQLATRQASSTRLRRAVTTPDE